MTDKDRQAFDSEFGITSHFIGNGCSHGFKPAKSCPNLDCLDARLQRWWDEQAARDHYAPKLTEYEAIRIAAAGFEEYKTLGFAGAAVTALRAAGVRFKDEP